MAIIVLSLAQVWLCYIVIAQMAEALQNHCVSCKCWSLQLGQFEAVQYTCMHSPSSSPPSPQAHFYFGSFRDKVPISPYPPKRQIVVESFMLLFSVCGRQFPVASAWHRFVAENRHAGFQQLKLLSYNLYYYCYYCCHYHYYHCHY